MGGYYHRGSSSSKHEGLKGWVVCWLGVEGGTKSGRLRLVENGGVGGEERGGGDRGEHRRQETKVTCMKAR